MRTIIIAVFGLLCAARPTLAEAPTIAIRLAAREPNGKAGQAMVVRVTTVNESDHPISYENTSPYCNYRFKVLTAAGAPAPQSDLQQRMTDCSGGHLPPGGVWVPGTTGRDIFVTLKPGESGSEDLNIAEVYDLSQPGNYTVQVDRTFPGIGHFTSNVITVTVTP